MNSIADTITNVRRLMRKTCTTAALNAIREQFDCYDDEDDSVVESYDDLTACDAMRVNCYVKGTREFAGQFLFTPNNGSTPAEDFCDWTCGLNTEAKVQFNALMEEIVDALGFEC